MNFKMPRDVAEAAAKAQYEAACAFFRVAGYWEAWEELSDTERDNRITWMQTAFEAAVLLWRTHHGATVIEEGHAASIGFTEAVVVLPLEKEA